MGLSTRTTATRRVVSLFDDALSRLAADRVQRYALSRKLEDLGDMTALPSKPVVFTLAPLLTTFEHLAENDRAVVQFHLTALEAAPPEWEQAWTEHPGGRRSYNDDCMDKLPLNVVTEMARVIRELANGDTTPFSPPGGWQAWHVQARALSLAIPAASPKAIAPATSTESSP